MVVRASQPALTVSRAGPSDAALVLSARAGERWAQEALFRRYAAMANHLAYRLLLQDSDLDDLVQDSFIAAFENLERLADPQAFASWLCSIIVRTAHKRLRRKRLLERLGLARPAPLDLDALATRTTPPDVAAELRALYGVVQTLPTVLLIVLGMGWRFIGSRVNPGLEGAVLESHESSMLVSLADGSRIELDPRSELAVRASRSDRTDLDVRSGGASFDVAHVAGRTFQVSFAGVQVTVVGTRFSVRERRLASGERQVEVSVSRGLVEARSGDVHVKLGAGQSWSAPLEGSRAAPAVLAPSGVSSDAPSAPVPRAAPAVADAGAASVTEPSLGTISEPVPASPSEPALPPQSSPRVRTDAREPHAEPESPDAKALFEEANRARAAGNVAAAAQGYQAMLARYPRDPRAALAAFELGRLQMDRLGQPGQALGSLKRAVASASRGGFREDAMARIVSAYAASGATAACLRAQRAYLKQYPNGIHRATVQAQCGARVSP